MSEARAELHAYIRHLLAGMEGPKGGSQVADMWRTGSMPLAKRWDEYKQTCNRLKQPVVGSQSLFAKVWAEHKEIKEITAKGHAKCDT